MPDPTLFAAVKDPANRPNPYPLYARLREAPVALQDDGTYVVTTHAALRALLFDPRISSEDLPSTSHPRTGNPFKDWIINPFKDHVRTKHRPFIFRDPPDHDVLRRHVMREFTPERIRAMHGRVDGLVADLLDRRRDARAIDLVDDFSYPLPVTVICELLGVPPEDEGRFHGWATQLATALEPDARQDEAALGRNIETFDAIAAYMQDLIKDKRRHPKDDLLTGLATREDPQAGRMGDYDLIATSILLLIAGHETTVNLITNGMLTLLRFPAQLERLRAEPEIAPRLIEELLRYEPPVHFRTRKALAEIELAGTTIPAGAPVVLLFASGSRDPARFADPDRFDPDREDNQHFGFGGSLHFCVGAPLARLEAEAALVALARRLRNPRLLDDPPPYRPGASLRGPEHLRLAIDGVSPPDA
ncbi:cytochrome P450 [Methylobacterium sp. 4-46]|uniref:cytochrome P450 n=1 Tax=unclassified Methylobacterium TaxID=2615210 RepID=UPI000152DAD9|nr:MULTISPECIES: cytochrome P450 [Methylobacterium]ACA18939.1 cytochrome P450 [Methylobacterium sp. 4-46]WFT78162.1 cytochrome P450 [Methylobacterium nodulans]